MSHSWIGVRRSFSLRFAVIFTAISLLVASAGPVLAASGNLDTTFGGTGIVITDVNVNSVDTAYGVLVQSDGKIVAVGSATSGAKSNLALVRYNSNGVADSSFGSNGIVVTSVSAGNDAIYAGALQSDGNIVVAGASATNVVVARYLSTTGGLDSSFNTTGIVTTSIGASATGQAVAIQSDGKIVVAGTANSHIFVARYNTNGSLDTNFHSTGIVTTTVAAADWGQGVAIQTDGKIIVVGYSDTGVTFDFAVVRYTTAGALDTTFNVTGKVTTDFQNSQDQGNSVALQSDGKIVVSGYVSAGTGKFGTARYNTNGSLDTTFGAGGKVMTSIGTADEAKAVAIQPTGKIVVAGDTSNGTNYDFVVMRYKSDGTLDTSFNSTGPTPGITQNDLANSDDLAYAVAIQPDNNIVVAGSCDQGTATALDFAVVRYQSPIIPPTVTGFSKSALEDQVIPFTVADFTGNYSDTEGASMAAAKITALPANGTLKLNNTTVTLNQVITTANLSNLTFTPDTAWYGSTSFNWNASNGLVYATVDATVSISVTYVNHAPSFTGGPNQTVLENAGPVTVTGWASNISAGPPSESWQVMTFTTSTSNNALFASLPTIGATTGNLAYTPAPNVYGAATVTVTLQDNGGVANGGSDTSAAQTFAITVTYINQAPSFTGGSDQTVLENAGAQTVPAWAGNISAGPPSELWQVVTFTTSTNNNALFSQLPAINRTSGNLNFTPAPNVYGSAFVTVTLQDSGGTANGGVNTSAPQTFAITVTYVNQSPSFTKGPDITVITSTPQSFANWASNISAGPPNESWQAMTFTVTNNNNALFGQQPSLSPTGTLTFQPTPYYNGSAQVTVIQHDNGGTANGGQDTSPAQTFKITVVSNPDSPINIVPGQQNTNINTPLVFSTAQGNRLGVYDPDAVLFNELINVTLTPTHGTVTLNGSTGLTLTSGTGNQDASVAFTGLLADVNNALDGLRFDPATGFFGLTSLVITSQDSGHPGEPGSFVVADPVNIFVNAPPVAVDDVYTGLENTMLVVPAGTGVLSNDIARNGHAITATLLTTPGVGSLVLNQDGSFIYFTPLYFNSVITFTYQANDNGLVSGVATVTLTIQYVNQQPYFTKGPDQSVLENAGPQSVSAWATAISPGASNESQQVLTFTLTTNNNALFSALPAIDASNGILSYTPATKVYGAAVVTVTLKDSGGTANGGKDTSLAQTFTITVAYVNQPPSFNRGADQTVRVGAGLQTVNAWATNVSPGAPGESWQVLTFTLVTSNDALFAQLPGISTTTGALTYEPSVHTWGSAVITVTLQDSGGTGNGGVDTSPAQMFMLSVKPYQAYAPIIRRP